MRILVVIGSLFVLVLAGCSENNPGSEVDARKFLESEFKKWMSEQENSVAPMMSRVHRDKPPLSYDVRSILKDKPDFLATQDSNNLPDNWREWPAYKFNIAIEFKSTAGTPVKKITSYTLTWNSSEKRWYITERF